MKSGAHTVGNPSERPSVSRSDFPREFAEAQFFLTVDIEEHETPDGVRHPKETHFLVLAKPMSVHSDRGLFVVNRIAAARRDRRNKTNNRRYTPAKGRWLDVDDIVDLIGLMYCKDEEYVCWHDACWDAVARNRHAPLVWRFLPDPRGGDLADEGGPGHQNVSGRIQRLIDQGNMPTVGRRNGGSDVDMEDEAAGCDPLFGSTDLEASSDVAAGTGIRKRHRVADDSDYEEGATNHRRRGQQGRGRGRQAARVRFRIGRAPANPAPPALSPPPQSRPRNPSDIPDDLFT
ncbi:hypothetical protein BJ508DRAFT_336756 [Ascobolus immersus RN42]|uniref:Uncharacterized protein n=1 Tax=Ascobolus immersus RN42 TaxID=1160509 RepID=A0A3N4HMC3_ASCIM|nr:hypothetical protein BJ508DRAFT_336756 [Ascobolus immersus RN42]